MGIPRFSSLLPHSIWKDLLRLPNNVRLGLWRFSFPHSLLLIVPPMPSFNLSVLLSPAPLLHPLWLLPMKLASPFICSVLAPTIPSSRLHQPHERPLPKRERPKTQGWMESPLSPLVNNDSGSPFDFTETNHGSYC